MLFLKQIFIVKAVSENAGSSTSCSNTSCSSGKCSNTSSPQQQVLENLLTTFGKLLSPEGGLEPIPAFLLQEEQRYEDAVAHIDEKLARLRAKIAAVDNDKDLLQKEHEAVVKSLVDGKTKYAHQCEAYLHLKDIESPDCEDAVIRDAQHENLRLLLNASFVPPTKDLHDFREKVVQTQFKSLYDKAAEYNPGGFTIFSKSI